MKTTTYCKLTITKSVILYLLLFLTFIKPHHLSTVSSVFSLFFSFLLFCFVLFLLYCAYKLAPRHRKSWVWSKRSSVERVMAAKVEEDVVEVQDPKWRMQELRGPAPQKSSCTPWPRPLAAGRSYASTWPERASGGRTPSCIRGRTHLPKMKKRKFKRLPRNKYRQLVPIESTHADASFPLYFISAKLHAIARYEKIELDLGLNRTHRY